MREEKIVKVGRRLKEYCREHNVTFGKVLKTTGISTNAYQWFSTERESSLQKIEEICESFGESLENFFFGYDGRALTDSQKEFLERWRSLSSVEKERIVETMKIFEEIKTVHF